MLFFHCQQLCDAAAKARWMFELLNHLDLFGNEYVENYQHHSEIKYMSATNNTNSTLTVRRTASCACHPQIKSGLINVDKLVQLTMALLTLKKSFIMDPLRLLHITPIVLSWDIFHQTM